MALFKGNSFSQLNLFEEATRRIDESRVVVIVYTDIRKAFDKVPHDRLVQKIRSHGNQGELVNIELG